MKSVLIAICVSRSFFCDLSQESIDAFNKIKHAAVFPEHAVVLVEGQSPCGIFILCQGRAKLSTTSREGKTLMIRIAEPGEILGLHALVTGGRYELTVETMQPCQLDYVGRDDMLRFLKDHADAALHATQHLARDCFDAYGVARTIGLSHSVSERFARFLLETAADGEVSNGTVRVRLAMPHEEIRKLVGTSRETITRLLSEFRRNETAELKGSTLIIHNPPALKNMVRALTALWGTSDTHYAELVAAKGARELRSAWTVEGARPHTSWSGGRHIL